MTSEAIRDPAKDSLLTPQNSALVIIDYQPVQVTSIASMDRRMLVDNIVSVARLARLFGLPIVLSGGVFQNRVLVESLIEQLGPDFLGPVTPDVGANVAVVGPRQHARD